MIYISTGGFADKNFFDTATMLLQYGLSAFELSAGRPVEAIEPLLLQLAESASLTLHNYFPPPPEPFVFNLASLNEAVSQRSINHARYAIDLSALVGARYFSFHAGFLMDPDVKELGQHIGKRRLNDREQALAVFVERVNMLAEYARKQNIKLLVENNVLSSNNYRQFGSNPLLMVDIEETAEIMKKLSANVALLIDVAHLKVSANSLGFDGTDYLHEFSGITEAYHLSDNDGLADTNGLIDETAWFWPHIRQDLDYYSIEVYRQPAQMLAEQYTLVQKGLGQQHVR